MSEKDEYYRIALPMELKDAIEKYIAENKHLGYKSTPEFVKEAIRILLMDREEKTLLRRVLDLEKERKNLIEQIESMK